MIAELKESAAFKAFMERAQDKAKEWVDTLKSSGDVNELYRAQGAVNFYNYIEDLPDVMIEEENLKKEEDKDSGNNEEHD